MVDYVHGDNAAALDDAAAVHSIVVEHYTRKYRIIVFTLDGQDFCCTFSDPDSDS